MVELDMKKICRVCLQTDPCLLPLFVVQVNTVDSISLPAMIAECTNHEVSPNDGHPDLICNECIGKSLSAYDFKKLYEASHRTLTAYLASVKSTNEECKLSILSDKCAEAAVFAKHPSEAMMKSESKSSTKTEIVGSHPKLEAGENSNTRAQTEFIEIEELIIKEEIETSTVSHIPAPSGHTESTEGEPSETIKLEQNNNSVSRTESLKKIPLMWNDKPLQCDDRLNLYKRRIQYKGTDLKIQPLECTVCDMKFIKRDAFNLHMAKHEGLSKCDFCHLYFAKEHILKRHTSEVHGVQNSTKKDVDDNPSLAPSTPLVKRIYECDPLTQYHTKVQWPHISCLEEIQKLCCSECGKAYQYRTALKKHMVKHHGTYKCRDCGKKFLWAFELKMHRREHTLKFPCDICSKSYNLKSSLTNHKRYKHKEITPKLSGS